jgi:CBS domain containing-hemolysin-like protein
VLSAYFSGLEIAFISANRLRIELDKKQGLFSAKIVSIFTRNPSKLIATLLIGNNIVLVIYGIEMALILEPFLHKFIEHEYYVLAIQTVSSTILILVTAEFLPKTVFRLLPNVFLNYLSVPTFLFYIVLYPVTVAFMWISNQFIKSLTKSKAPTGENMYVFGKVDLDHLVGQSGKETLDTENEIRIFQNALDFSKVKLRECMVPRTEVVAVDATISAEDLRKKFIETGFSKILVYEGGIDNIIGYVSSKELFKTPFYMRNKIVKAPIVPETMNANKLLNILLQEHKSIAVVVDEFGGTSGIVTIEDIIEEIFGEIEDEHDTDEIVEKTLSDTAFIFSGKLQIDYLNKKYGLKIADSEEYETLAGYVFFHIGRIPALNEKFTVGNYDFKILKINNKRLELIYMKNTGE